MAIIGLGYVGLPLAILCAQRGYETLGIDTNQRLIEELKKGNTESPDIDKKQLKELVKSGRLIISSDYSTMINIDVIVLCVPTPLTDSSEPDLTYVVEATKSIASRLSQNCLFISESTSFPGTLRQVILPLLSNLSGMPNSSILELAVAPERINPGSGLQISDIPRVVGGIDRESTGSAKEFYESLGFKVYAVKNPEVAELSKMIENTFRFINISFINELQEVCLRAELDLRSAIEAASTKPYGFMPFYPSAGIGGHCIPVDSEYLQHFARTLGTGVESIATAKAINDSMGASIVRRILLHLKFKSEDLAGKKILLVGVAYKPNISDSRETPAQKIFCKLRENGAQVFWHDELVASWEDSSSSPIESQFWDLCIVLTAHSYIDIKKLMKNSRNVFDATGAFKSEAKIIQI